MAYQACGVDFYIIIVMHFFHKTAVLNQMHIKIYLHQNGLQCFLGRSQVRPYAIQNLSVCLSDTLVICDHTFQLIETILVLMESPNILVAGKVSLVQISHS